MSEGFLFLGVMILASVLSLSIAIFTRTLSRKKHLFITQTINLLLFSTAVHWWFSYASDGFSQVFGSYFYGMAFVVVAFINFLLSVKLAKTS